MQVSAAPTLVPNARGRAIRFRRRRLLGSPALMLMGILIVPAVASAHAKLTDPMPRDQSTQHKDPDGPCGVTRATTQPNNNLTPGASYMVKWGETVNHPGCFVIDFSASGDTNWQVLSTIAHKTTGGTPSDANPRMYSQMVTLPAAPCTACTLRLRQIMLSAEPAAGAACPPANLAMGSTYFSCANVTMAAGDGGAPDSGGTGSGGAGGRGGGGNGGRGGGGATGGAMGTGGVTVPGSGGASNPGTGGAVTSSGGATNPGSGGAVTSSGGATNPGSGGASNPGTGGATASTGGAGGPGVTQPDPPACSCGVTNTHTLSTSALLIGVLLAMNVGRSRARRRSRTHHNP